MRACAKTTPGGIRRIRRGGCVAIGPLARNRPSDPNASNAPQSPKALTEAEAIRGPKGGGGVFFVFVQGLHRPVFSPFPVVRYETPPGGKDLRKGASHH